jgi:hypothetical protein
MRLPRFAAALAGVGLGWVMAHAGQPPVLLDLGRVNPTPAPTEKAYDKKRLITSLTVQNTPEGETIITFEASDVGRTPDGKYKPIASRRYSLTEVKEKYRLLKDDSLRDLRVLERALLRYVDAVGGPKDRSQVKSGVERPQ